MSLDSDDDDVMDEILCDKEMTDNDIDTSYDEANSDLEWITFHESKRRVGSPGVFITPGTYFIQGIISF